MFLQIRDADKLQVLLSRFVDEETLTSEVVYKTSEYLFFNSTSIPSVQDETLVQTLVYLKDLMEVNGLITVDDILSYYARRRTSLRLFMHRVVENSKIDLYQLAPTQIAVLVGWTFNNPLPKALPPSTNCINVCFTTACAIQLMPYVPMLAKPADNDRHSQDKHENEAVY
jgi:hypothetical protein